MCNFFPRISDLGFLSSFLPISRTSQGIQSGRRNEAGFLERFEFPVFLNELDFLRFNVLSPRFSLLTTSQGFGHI